MPPSSIGSDRSVRLESAAFYALLATVALAPLAFWPSPYFALEAVKTLVIALGTIVSLVLLAVIAAKEGSPRLPPRSMVWIGALLALATAVSSFASGHFMKSFFGQGFELGTGSFIILLLASGLVGFIVSAKRVDRVMAVYTTMVCAFFLLYLFHALRLIFGNGFANLGILSSIIATPVGNWYALGIYAMLVAILILVAVIALPLSSRLKKLYWILFALSAVGTFLVNSTQVWQAAAVVFLGLTLYVTYTRPRASAPGLSARLRRVAWIPLVAFVFCIALAFRGGDLAGPVLTRLNLGYSELSLPWQMTMDVAAGSLKAAPLFGTGPNRFVQAYLANKPAGINQTDGWSVEFNSGFGFIPTFAVTEGALGIIMWAVFLVFFGILGAKSLKALRNGSESPYARFVVLSSFAGASFLWIMSMLYVMPHAMTYFAFLMTGLWLGSSVSFGFLRPLDLFAGAPVRRVRAVSIALWILAAVFVLWGLTFIKNSVALAYFGGGIHALTEKGDPVAADRSFARALALNPADVYWQARAESVLSQAKTAVASAAGADAAATAEIAKTAAGLVNQALLYAENAIVSDSDNYYNFLSAARVSEVAAGLRMNKGYETGLSAYGNAIKLNPQNPSLYVSLARFQASNNQLDQALQTIGASLQVKSNYLDAVFLLSQVEAAKGNLPDAITASQFAIRLNPANPLLYFQLGLLQYTAADYAGAAATLTEAVRIQPDYANARYFLGLANARLGHNAEALAQFQQLIVTNPDNQEISAIITSLRAGRSLFSGAKPALATAPEKRPNPPLQEKKR